MSKSQFILSFPLHAPTKEIIAAAKRKGMKLSANYVYMVRAAAKKKPAPVERPKEAAPVGKIDTGEVSAAKVALVSIAAIIGLNEAIEALCNVRSNARAILKGSSHE